MIDTTIQHINSECPLNYFPEKRCCHCKERKPLSDFTAAARLRRYTYCIDCIRAYREIPNSVRHQLHHERLRESYRTQKRRRHESYLRSIARDPQRAMIRQNAYILVQKAIHDGVIVRPETCSACGKIGRIHGHHPDYNKPLELVWLCGSCHSAEHHRLRKEQAA